MKTLQTMTPQRPSADLSKHAIYKCYGQQTPDQSHLLAPGLKCDFANIHLDPNKVSRVSLPAGPGAGAATDECTHSARSWLKIGRKVGDTHLARLIYQSDSAPV